MSAGRLIANRFQISVLGKDLLRIPGVGRVRAQVPPILRDGLHFALGVHRRPGAPRGDGGVGQIRRGRPGAALSAGIAGHKDQARGAQGRRK
jgi:hypothetical protein